MPYLSKLNGIFKHYKGGYYNVINIAANTETGEKLVIYRSVTKAPNRNNEFVVKDNKIWTRPYDMFHSNVTINNISLKRFTQVKD